jgi:hypothetical protein
MGAPQKQLKIALGHNTDDVTMPGDVDETKA